MKVQSKNKKHLIEVVELFSMWYLYHDTLAEPFAIKVPRYFDKLYLTQNITSFIIFVTLFLKQKTTVIN